MIILCERCKEREMERSNIQEVLNFAFDRNRACYFICSYCCEEMADCSDCVQAVFPGVRL